MLWLHSNKSFSTRTHVSLASSSLISQSQKLLNDGISVKWHQKPYKCWKALLHLILQSDSQLLSVLLSHGLMRFVSLKLINSSEHTGSWSNKKQPRCVRSIHHTITLLILRREIGIGASLLSQELQCVRTIRPIPFMKTAQRLIR